jgi:protocatechuate 4,5-dioxygenase alpha chain
MTGPRDIHAYLAEFDDIPGTRIFTAAQARKGYWLNQFCMSLMKPENRTRFKADESAYLEQWPMTGPQKKTVLERDYNRAIEEGGNIYFLAKLIATDEIAFQKGVSTMTGMSPEEYMAMMVAGGRSPEGLRSKKEGR